jgi:deoxyribonuclease-4
MAARDQKTTGKRIRFGPAGLGSPAEKGLNRCHKLGLQAAEVAFTYGVYLDNRQAEQLGEQAKELDIRLSVHAPYYINLASHDADKRKASRRRILDSCERAHHMGAENVVFHAGFYQDRDRETVYREIRKETRRLQRMIERRKWRVHLAPETMGKASQFSDLETLLRLERDTGCRICIDFAHLFALSQGQADYHTILNQLGRRRHLHAHFSGIVYGPKGERNHVRLTQKFFRPLAVALQDAAFKTMTIISEAPPNTFRSAANMQRWMGKM